MELIIVALGFVVLVKFISACLSHETPRQAHSRAMLESYQALREGRLNRQDSYRSEYRANLDMVRK